MNKLKRYISTTISSAILLVLVVLIGVNVLAGIIDEVRDLRGGYTFIEALRFVLLSIPGSFYEFLPFASLVGCLVGLGSLANNSELVVIRSAGVSIGRIFWMVMRPVLVIMLVGLLISEYIAPQATGIAESERAIALGKDENVFSRGGLWHREGNVFMHFNVVQPGGVLYGVTLYHFDDNRQLLKASFAKRATYQQDHWLLEDLSSSVFHGDTITKETLQTVVWDLDISPDFLSILIRKPSDLRISDLWKYSKYREGQGLDSREYMQAFWKKVLGPLSTIALVLVAISFIFGPLRQVTMGYRVFMGVLVGLVFRTAQDILAPASLVYGFEPIYASLVPILICVVVGLYLLKRAA